MKYITGDKNIEEYMMKNILKDDEFFLMMRLDTYRYELGNRILEKRIKRSYPFLIDFKEDNQTWSDLYFRNMRYIRILKDKYGIIYPKGFEFYSPKELLTKYNLDNYDDCYQMKIQIAAESGNKTELFSLLNYVLNNRKNFESVERMFEVSLWGCIFSKEFSLYEKIEEKYWNQLENIGRTYFICETINDKDKDVIDFLFTGYIPNENNDQMILTKLLRTDNAKIIAYVLANYFRHKMAEWLTDY